MKSNALSSNPTPYTIKRYTHSNAHSTVYNNQDKEAPQCPLTNKWIKKVKYIYTMEYNSAIKRIEIMPSAATWMDLEIIILSEVSQREKDKYHVMLLIC